MTAFNAHTPEPGWAKRWPKEAASLILKTPEAFAAFLVLMPVVGAINGVVIKASEGSHFTMPASHIVTTTLGCAVVMIMMKMFFRKEGYRSGGISSGQMTLPFIKISVYTAFLCVASLLLLGVTSVITVEGARPEDAAQISLRTYAMLGHMDIGYFFMTFAIMGLSSPVLCAGGMTGHEAFEASKKVDAKMEGLHRRFSLIACVAAAALYVSGPLAIFLGPFFVALNYVAVKEIFGGPGLRSRTTSKTASRVAEPQFA